MKELKGKDRILPNHIFNDGTRVCDYEPNSNILKSGMTYKTLKKLLGVCVLGNHWKIYKP